MFTQKAQEDLRNEENQESFSMEIAGADVLEAAGLNVTDEGAFTAKPWANKSTPLPASRHPINLVRYREV